jgi:adenylate cyclase
MSRRAFQTLIALILAGLWGAGLGLAHMQGDVWLVDRVEATMTDLRTAIRGQKPAPGTVTIVAIDDEVVRQEGSYPLARATLARLIDKITELNPKVIGIDLLLVDPGPEDGDHALALSLGRSTSVLAAAAVFPEGQQRIETNPDDPLSSIPSAQRFLLPTKPFVDAAAVGVVNVSTDRNGTPRLGEGSRAHHRAGPHLAWGTDNPDRHRSGLAFDLLRYQKHDSDVQRCGCPERETEPR